MPTFDPNAAAAPGSGVFGLPFTRNDSRIVLVPVPFDATTSYGGGASGGPAAIMRASRQVDLFDLQFGRVYEAGIFMEAIDGKIAKLSREARTLAAPIIEAGGASDKDAGAVARINRAGEQVNEFVKAAAAKVLEEGKIPGIIGGDHSVPFGAIQACAEKAGREGLGVLQIDAHMDLREEFEGFTWSHASIMHNVMSRIGNIKRLVQVGIRDFSEGELQAARQFGMPVTSQDSWVVDMGPGRVATHFDLDWSRRLDSGEPFGRICQHAIDALPRLVYISFDIDGLDPALCPHTGTPVPGGLSFNRVCHLLEALHRTGRTIVGFDLCEVCPSSDESDEWDANVGARVLYKLCGCAAGRVMEA